MYLYLIHSLGQIHKLTYKITGYSYTFWGYSLDGQIVTIFNTANLVPEKTIDMDDIILHTQFIQQFEINVDCHEIHNNIVAFGSWREALAEFNRWLKTWHNDYTPLQSWNDLDHFLQHSTYIHHIGKHHGQNIAAKLSSEECQYIANWFADQLHDNNRLVNNVVAPLLGLKKPSELENITLRLQYWNTFIIRLDKQLQSYINLQALNADYQLLLNTYQLSKDCWQSRNGKLHIIQKIDNYVALNNIEMLLQALWEIINNAFNNGILNIQLLQNIIINIKRLLQDKYLNVCSLRPLTISSAQHFPSYIVIRTTHFDVDYIYQQPQIRLPSDLYNMAITWAILQSRIDYHINNNLPLSIAPFLYYTNLINVYGNNVSHKLGYNLRWALPIIHQSDTLEIKKAHTCIYIPENYLSIINAFKFSYISEWSTRHNNTIIIPKIQFGNKISTQAKTNIPARENNLYHLYELLQQNTNITKDKPEISHVDVNIFNILDQLYIHIREWLLYIQKGYLYSTDYINILFSQVNLIIPLIDKSVKISPNITNTSIAASSSQIKETKAASSSQSNLIHIHANNSTTPDIRGYKMIKLQEIDRLSNLAQLVLDLHDNIANIWQMIELNDVPVIRLDVLINICNGLSKSLDLTIKKHSLPHGKTGSIKAICNWYNTQPSGYHLKLLNNRHIYLPLISPNLKAYNQEELEEILAFLDTVVDGNIICDDLRNNIVKLLSQ